MKIKISILSQKAPPTVEETHCKAPSLDDKIEYALECMAADVNKEQAVEFLQKVYHHISCQHPYTEKHSAMMEKLSAVFGDYGINFKEQEQEQDY
jgi:hypothetical protein